MAELILYLLVFYEKRLKLINKVRLIKQLALKCSSWKSITVPLWWIMQVGIKFCYSLFERILKCRSQIRDICYQFKQRVLMDLLGACHLILSKNITENILTNLPCASYKYHLGHALLNQALFQHFFRFLCRGGKHSALTKPWSWFSSASFFLLLSNSLASCKR